MLIFWVHILFLVTTRAGLHALTLKKLISFVIQQHYYFFQDFCLCLTCPVVALALLLKAYSALIGQFKLSLSDEPIEKPSTL